MNSELVSTPIDASAVFAALETWIKQRPGLDTRNYYDRAFERNERGKLERSSGFKAYRQEVRDIGRDRTRALKALDEARSLEPVKPELLADAFRAYSGRLQWKAEPSEGERLDGITAALLGLPRLEYCTGQYFPTEYRKAAAAVLEAYISAWRQWYASEHPQTYTYRTMDDVIAANRAIGNHWFDASTMRFFKTRIESGLVAGKRFITSEKGPDEVRRYTVREAQPDGTIDTVGEFQQYRTRDAARAAILK